MKLLITLFFSFFFAITTFSQFDGWHTSLLPRGSAIGDLPYAGIVEGEDEVHLLGGKQFMSWTAYGRELSTFDTKGPFWSNIFYAGLQDDFLVYAYIKFHGTGDALYLNTISKEGETGFSDFILKDIAAHDSGRGLAGVKIADHLFFIMGPTQMHLVEIKDFSNVEIVWSKQHNFGKINKAILKDDKIILAGRNGNAYFLNLDGSLHLSRSYNFPLYTVTALEEGLVFGGQNGKMVMTNPLGFPQQELSATAFFVNDMTTTTDGGFAITGRTLDGRTFVTKYDVNGEMSWNKFLEGDQGLNIVNSKYTDDIYLSAGIELDFKLYKIDAEGTIGERLVREKSFALQVNDIQARTSAEGKIFYDPEESYFQYPAGSNTKTIETVDLWMSGVLGSEYSTSIGNYYYPGVFDDYLNGDLYTFDDDVWSVSQIEIDKFRDDIADGHKDLPWTHDYLFWPAKGNTVPTLGNELLEITIDLAPFHDVDGDGLYNPLLGDYPAIKGDQMLWWVMNTNFRSDTHCSLYAFNCGEESVLNTTLFLEFDFLCRSSFSFEDVKLGLRMDADIGNSCDDYLGSIPELNSTYAYNMDAEDGIEPDSLCHNPISSFPNDIPLQSLTFLNQKMTAFTCFPYVGDQGILTSTFDDSLRNQKVHNYMSGKWADGTPFTYGGTGYDLSSTDFHPFAFSGDPGDPSQWSMCSTGMASYELMSLASTSIGSVQNGDRMQLATAFITHPDVSLPCPGMTGVKNNIQTVQNFYNQTAGVIERDFFPDTIFVDASSYVLDPDLTIDQYNWSTGATSPTIEVTASGNYYLDVGYDGLCTIRDEVYVKFNNENIPDELIIYPNPSLGDFSIQFGSWEPGEERYVRIYSAAGQLIDEFRLAISEDKKIELSVPDLAHGVYVLSLFTMDGERELSGKVVLGD